MKHLLVAAALCVTAAFASPAIAQQGTGGYSDGAPGAATATASSGTVKHARRNHATNDTSSGTSSIDKSGTAQEAGGTTAGAHGQDQAMGAHAPGNTGGTKTIPNGQ
jgi:hypothetical protein